MEAGASRSQQVELPPEYFGHGRPPRKFAAAGWFALALLLFMLLALGSMAVGAIFNEKPGGRFVSLVVGLLLGTVLGLPAAKCVIRAKRLRAPSALEVFKRDQRPPVVYFRPFTADVDASKRVALTSWFTEEEQLAKMMNEIGPLVAIGAPEEAMPLLGAARMYVDDPRWHEAALDLLRRARMIIMRIGSSQGFWWEFENVLKNIKPEQLVLLIPRNQALYEQFQHASRKLIPTVLPTLTGWNVKKLFRGNLKAVIFFDREWVPSIVDVQTYRLPFLRRSPATPLVPVLKSALRPVYEQLGLKWAMPRVNRRMLLVLSAAALYSLVVIVPAVTEMLDRQSHGAAFSQDPLVGGVRLDQSEVTIAMDRLSKRMQQEPELRSRLEKLIASAPEPKDPQQVREAAQQLGARLSKAGMKRLDDGSLLAMGAIQRKLLMQAELAGCAALARGNPGSRLLPMLENLGAEDVDRFFDLTYQAMIAEAKETPAARQANYPRLKENLNTILADLPEQDGARLKNDLSNGTGSNDEETCWMGRTLQAGLDRLSRRDQIQWLLANADQ